MLHLVLCKASSVTVSKVIPLGVAGPQQRQLCLVIKHDAQSLIDLKAKGSDRLQDLQQAQQRLPMHYLCLQKTSSFSRVL